MLVGVVACSSDESPDPASETTQVAAQPVIPTLPDGGIVDTQPNSGWTEGSFSVDDDGAARYHLPLWVPDGRRGMQPELALDYSSAAGNGLIGVGWSVTGLSSIRPCQATLAADGVNAAPGFVGGDLLCLDGQRLRLKSSGASEREYRVEHESFAKVIGYVSGEPGTQPTHFKVWTRDGRILTFGNTPASKMKAYTLVGIQPENPAFQKSATRVIAAWALNRIEDRNANKIDIAYETIERADDRHSVEFVATQITYGPDRKVEFVLEPRPDAMDGFQSGATGGVHTALRRRLKTIKLSTGDVALREYRLDYADSTADSITGRSLLTRISACDSANVCLNPVEFTYSLGKTGDADYEFETIELGGVTDVGTFAASRYTYVPGDVDGDGKDDVIYGDQNNNWKWRLSTGTGFGAAKNLGVPRAGDGTTKPRMRPVDYDRDGRLDLLVEVPCDGCLPATLTRFALYRSTGTGFQLVPDLDPLSTHPVNGVWNAFWIDLDGNGAVDYLAPRFELPSLRWRYRLNLGTGAFTPMIESQVLTPRPVHHSWATFPTRSTSLRGHGVSNLLIWGAYDADDQDPELDADYDAIRLTSFGLLGSTGNLNLPFQKRPENGSTDQPRHDGLQFADLNGDGLPDAVYLLQGVLHVQLNSGSGFSDIINGNTAQDYSYPFSNLDGYTPGFRILDFNNDGADDILVLHFGTSAPYDPANYQFNWHLYTWRNGTFVRSPILPGWATGSPVFEHVQPLDFNGDGMTDLASAAPGHLRLYKRKGTPPDKLVRVKVPGLGTTPCATCRVEIEYTTLADRARHTPCAPAYPLVCSRRGGSIVAKHRLATGDAQNLWNEFTHTYANARTDVRGRGWLGFSSHAVSSLGGSIVTTTAFDNTTRLDLSFPGTYVYPYAHMPGSVSTQIIHADGLVYHHNEIHQYASSTGAVPRTYTVQTTSSSVSDLEKLVPNGSRPLHTRSTTVETRDAFMNPTRVKTVEPGSDRVVTLTYDNLEADWLIGQLKSTTTTDCLRPSNACQTRAVNYAYDVGTGNLHQVMVEPNDPALRLRTLYGYANWGNVLTVRIADSAGPSCTSDGQCQAGQSCVEGSCGTERGMTFAYDTRELYPTTTTNLLGHYTEVKRDPDLGVPIASWDANRVPITRRYDRFGRLRETSYATGYFERLTSDGPLVQITTVPSGDGGTIESSRVVLDRLGRPIEQRHLAFDGSVSVTATEYDLRGRVSRTSSPFALGATDIKYTTYSYDLRNRLKSAVAPDGATTRHDYIGLETHSFDARNTESYVVERGDGRLLARYEDDPASDNWLPTTYGYRPFGMLGSVTAPDGTVQTITYDKRGRRSTLVDPTTGTTTTTYNAFGDVLTETNGANQLETFTYDQLGRPLTVAADGGTTTFTWDPVNQKGKLNTALSRDGVLTTYDYDDIGRSTNTTWAVEGTSYQVTLGYDGIGRPSTVTYPAFPGVTSRTQVKYTYKPTGYLEQIEDATTGGVLWKVNRRNIANQLEQETYGSPATPVTATRTYDPFTGLLASIAVDGPGGPLDSLQYAYDANRNVTQRKDLVGAGARTQDFTYDELNRMKTWRFSDAASAVTGTFDYNAMGNLLGETYEGRSGMNVSYGYRGPGAPPHALISRAGQAYSYDGAGRQITMPGGTATYNRFNLPKVITRDGQATTFTYDANGARLLKRNAAGQTTLTVAGLFERRVAGDAKNVHYVVAGGRAVAQITRTQATPTGAVASTQVRYLHADGQGSTTLTTNSSGAMIDELFYDPFGRPSDRNYVPLAPQNRVISLGYTGQVHDDDLAVINLQGRIYDPVARSFLSPDPIADPLFSQRLNRYSYAVNNPATLVDPMGLDPEDPGQQQPDCYYVGFITVCTGAGGPPGGGGGGGDPSGNCGGGDCTGSTGTPGASDDSDIHVSSRRSSSSDDEPKWFMGELGDKIYLDGSAETIWGKRSDGGLQAIIALADVASLQTGPVLRAIIDADGVEDVSYEWNGSIDFGGFPTATWHHRSDGLSSQVDMHSGEYQLFSFLGTAVGVIAGVAPAMRGPQSVAGAEAAAARVETAVRPLVYGPSANQQLRATAERLGGQTLGQLPKHPEMGWPTFSLQTLDAAAASGRPVIFDLTHVQELQGVLNGTSRFSGTITGLELQYVKAHWGRFKNVVTFYRDGNPLTVPPW